MSEAGLRKILIGLSRSTAIAAALTVSPALLASEECGDPESSALAVVDAYLDTYNQGDAVTHAKTLQFPSYLISGDGAVYVFDDESKYAAMIKDSPPTWDHESFDEKRVVQKGPQKVHVAVKISRYGKDGGKLSAHESLWTVTCKAGDWGIISRSTYIVY